MSVYAQQIIKLEDFLDNFVVDLVPEGHLNHLMAEMYLHLQHLPVETLLGRHPELDLDHFMVDLILEGHLNQLLVEIYLQLHLQYLAVEAILERHSVLEILLLKILDLVVDLVLEAHLKVV